MSYLYSRNLNLGSRSQSHAKFRQIYDLENLFYFQMAFLRHWLFFDDLFRYFSNPASSSSQVLMCTVSFHIFIEILSLDRIWSLHCTSGLSTFTFHSTSRPPPWTPLSLCDSHQLQTRIMKADPPIPASPCPPQHARTNVKSDSWSTFFLKGSATRIGWMLWSIETKRPYQWTFYLSGSVVWAVHREIRMSKESVPMWRLIFTFNKLSRFTKILSNTCLMNEGASRTTKHIHRLLVLRK